MSCCDWKSLHLVLLFVVSLWVLVYGVHINDDGFTFDMPEDVAPVQPPQLNHHYAVVGEIFHFEAHEKQSEKGFTVKWLIFCWIYVMEGFLQLKTENKKLPQWLIFNKNTATFWGVPLPGDEETLHITVTSLDDSSDSVDAIIEVIEDDEYKIRKCVKSLSQISLRLPLLEKSLRLVKPKQRVIALKNIANFYNMPYVSTQ